ncbi:hypothetical protein HUJ04_011153 [Dendroctonus ponderosae]|nr:hypothetical protein HUJ04_011153 [Dendroctonus ponderosae]
MKSNKNKEFAHTAPSSGGSSNKSTSKVIVKPAPPKVHSTEITNPGDVSDIVSHVENRSSNVDVRRNTNVDGNSGEWVQVRSKHKQTKTVFNTKRPEPLRGQSENISNLKTVTRMAFLFLSGLAPEVTCDNVLDFLKENNLPENCRCRDIDITCLTEHWLTKEELEVIQIQGLSGFSSRSESIGGGTALFTKYFLAAKDVNMGWFDTTMKAFTAGQIT